MNYNELVINYLDSCPFDEPIFLNDIKDYVKNHLNKVFDIDKIMKNVNVLMNRLTKDNTITLFERGIYYKPTTNIFGIKKLNTTKVINQKYLICDDNVIGYISGAYLYNALGLTTQVPKYKLIITNNCPNNNKYNIDKLGITIKKPYITIDNDNYIYLQLLDLLANREKIDVEVDDNMRKEIIYNFIKENNLKFDKLFYYAKITNNKKAIENLYEIG